MYQVNQGKNLEMNLEGEIYYRIPIKTHVIMPEDNLIETIVKYANPVIEEGDILIVTEKIVAITQNRSFPVSSIKARPLASLLSRFVVKTPHGIGLGMPETMEMALRECGVPRILFAAVVSAFGKFVGRSGDFYRVAGEKARAIDGPTEGTLAPFDQYVVLAPDQPDQVCHEVCRELKKQVNVLVVDINDLGGNIMGSNCNEIDKLKMARVLQDNPLGQEAQCTPLGIIRRVK